MNTNIDEYTNDEIIKLLKITNAESYEEAKVREKIETIIRQIKESQTAVKNNKTDRRNKTNLITNPNQSSENNEEETDLMDFFRKCYLRLSVSRKFQLTDKAKAELDLHHLLPSQTYNDDIPHTRVVKEMPIENAIPELIPSSALAVQTRPIKYAQGSLNPIDYETIKYMLVLNSKFRNNSNSAYYNISQSDRIKMKSYTRTSTNNSLCNKLTTINGCQTIKQGDAGTVTDFTVELTSPYKDVIALKVASLTLDNFYYPVSEYLGSNHFTLITFDYDASALDPSSTKANEQKTVIKIPDGCYSAGELILALNTIITSSTISSLSAVEVVHNTIKNKIIIKLKATPPVPPPSGRQYGFNILFTHETNPTRPLYLNLGWMMGFKEADYDFFLDYNTVETNQLLVGFNPEGCLNLIGTTSFFLEIDDYNNNHSRVVDYNCTTNNSYNFNNIITRISNMAPFTAQSYEDSSDKIFKKREYFGPVGISKLRIRLMDENGIPVNLNEGSFTLSLEIETLTKTTKKMVL